MSTEAGDAGLRREIIAGLERTIWTPGDGVRDLDRGGGHQHGQERRQRGQLRYRGVEHVHLPLRHDQPPAVLVQHPAPGLRPADRGAGPVLRRQHRRQHAHPPVGPGRVPLAVRHRQALVPGVRPGHEPHRHGQVRGNHDGRRDQRLQVRGEGEERQDRHAEDPRVAGGPAGQQGT